MEWILTVGETALLSPVLGSNMAPPTRIERATHCLEGSNEGAYAPLSQVRQGVPKGHGASRSIVERVVE